MQFSGWKLGFKPEFEFFDDIFNRSLALLLLFLVFPLMAGIAVALLVTQGSEVVYRGARLGRDGRVFGILKFRTLDTAAAKALTAKRVLPAGSGIETPLGGFLRGSRLDELPQLFNVLNGDMRFCGPRPVRPEIAAIEAPNIPGYDARFSVKPGLIGPSQAYMSHSTSKRIRARLNSVLVRRPVNYWSDIKLMGVVGFLVLYRAAKGLWRRFVRRLKSSGDTVGHERAPIPEMWLELGGLGVTLRIQRMCTRSITLAETIALTESCNGVFVARLRTGGLRRANVGLTQSEKPGVVGYAATTEYGQFIIDRYGLDLAVVPPVLSQSPIRLGVSAPAAPRGAGVFGWLKARPVRLLGAVGR